MSDCIKLRPHHLLCTQGFGGKGYSVAFIKNMTAITGRLRTDASALVEIVFSTDDICRACPKMRGIGVCEDDDKVKLFDAKVAAYFGLKEKIGLYRDFIQDIHIRMTPAMMDDICGECGWYPVSACKRNVMTT